MPRVSIVMRSHNDADIVERTLQGIAMQDFRDYELICVDDASDDGTPELLQDAKPQQLIRLEPGSYVPGKILNHAVSLASGEIIVFNNSDAVPLNRSWLEELIAPLSGNPRCAAAFARQCPRPDALPLVVKDMTRAFGDGSVSSKWKHFFSLASSACSATLLRQYPFDEQLRYSEDTEWSFRIKQHGYSIAYAAKALVEHSHNYSDAGLRRRFYNEGVAERIIYGNANNWLSGFLCPFIAESCRDMLYLFREHQLHAIPGGLGKRFIQKFSTWQGRRSGRWMP